MSEKYFSENIFDYVNNNLFALLSRKDKRLNYELLDLTYSYIKDNENNRVDKDDLIDFLIDHIKTKLDVEIDDDDDKPISIKNPSEIVHYKLKQFIKYGWLSEDYGNDFITYISYTDSAIELINALRNIIKRENNELEYGGYTSVIYRILRDFNYDEGTSLIEQIDRNREVLQTSLFGLNNKIKRYIKKLVAKSDISPEEILHELTEKYRKQVTLTVFDNLKTKDNPNKYSNEIIMRLEQLLEQESIDRLVINYVATKKIELTSEEVSKEVEHFFEDRILKTINFYKTINETIDFIDSNNAKYLVNAKNILNFILSNTKDVEGEINKTLKLIKRCKSINDNDLLVEFANIVNISPIDDLSLYTPRFNKNKPNQVELFVEPLSEEEILEAKSKIVLSDEYSKRNINQFICAKLEDIFEKDKSTSFKLSEIKIDDFKTFMKYCLAFAYSEAKDMSYKVEKLDGYFAYNEFMMQDLRIVRKWEYGCFKSRFRRFC